jgi:hypothetical protein
MQINSAFEEWHCSNVQANMLAVNSIRTCHHALKHRNRKQKVFSRNVAAAAVAQVLLMMALLCCCGVVAEVITTAEATARALVLSREYQLSLRCRNC